MSTIEELYVQRGQIQAWAQSAAMGEQAAGSQAAHEVRQWLRERLPVQVAAVARTTEAVQRTQYALTQARALSEPVGDARERAIARIEREERIAEAQAAAEQAQRDHEAVTMQLRAAERQLWLTEHRRAVTIAESVVDSGVEQTLDLIDKVIAAAEQRLGGAACAPLRQGYRAFAAQLGTEQVKEARAWVIQLRKAAAALNLGLGPADYWTLRERNNGNQLYG